MPVLVPLSRPGSLAGAALPDAKRLTCGAPPVELVYDAMQVCEISLAIRTRRQLEAWVRGPLNSLLPALSLLACISEGDGGAMMFEAIDGHHGAPADSARNRGGAERLLLQLRKTWFVGGGHPFLIEVQSQSARTLGLPNGCGALVHGAPRLFGAESVIALISDRLDCEQAVHGVIELVAPYVQLAVQRIHRSSGEVGRMTMPFDEARTLSPREVRILEGVRDGLSNRQIGVLLNISQFTVKTHLQRIFRKLDVTNRAQALARALAERMLSSQ